MKTFIFTGYDEDFEDTVIRLYEAEDSDKVERMIKIDFLGIESEEELAEIKEEELKRYEDFVIDHPYKIVELTEIPTYNSKCYQFKK